MEVQELETLIECLGDGGQSLWFLASYVFAYRRLEWDSQHWTGSDASILLQRVMGYYYYAVGLSHLGAIVP